MRYLKNVTLLVVLTLSLMACGGEEKEAAPCSCSCSCPKANPNRPAWCPVDGTTGTLIDERDNNRQYKTVIINCQEWMAENYRRETGSYFVPLKDDKKFDVALYGLLYKRNTVIAKDFCPSGWHLPTRAEFEAFLTYINTYRGSSDALLALIANSPDWLLYPNKGGNDFGFSAMPAGAKNEEPNLYYDGGYRAYIWSATADEHYAYFLRIGDIAEGTAETKASVEGQGLNEAYAVRCLRDSLPQAAN